MTLTYEPNGAKLTVTTEQIPEIIMLGRLREKMPDSAVRTEGPKATLTMDVRQLLKVAAMGKLSEP